jgi:beta-glucosidase
VHPVLKNVTIDQWGLDGIICTDGGALKLLVTAHRYYPDLAQAAAWCIKCGISQFLDQFRDAIKQAIERNLLSERQIEQAVRRNFRVMIRLGLWDPPDMVPYARIGTNAGSHNDAALGGRTEQPCPPWLSEAHKSLAKLVTLKSIVLLKNADAALPLDRTRIKSIAVIGRWADQVIPDWYGGGPAYRITPLQGIRAKVGADVTVAHASGEDAEQTARLARKSDVVIMVVGNHPTCDAGWAKTISPSMGKEAVDRQSLELDEQPLIRRVYEENRRTIVVLISSFPYAINWAQQHIPAIVHMTHASQETGSALADVLFGDYNPAGRLVQTWPGSLDDLPDLFDYDLRRGRTYMYFTGQPLYPFGHGLSYTTFVYSNLCVSEQTIDAQGQITVSADVTNSGQRSGEEVVQLYVKYLDSKVDRPIRQLVGFARLAIEPGRTVTARIPLRASQLAYWDATERGWRVEPGRVELMLGASSADIRLRRIIQVSGPQSNVNPGCFSRGGQSEG